jgi:hypothetical protein
MESLRNVPNAQPARLVSVSDCLLRKVREYGLHLADILQILRSAPMVVSLLRGVASLGTSLWRLNASRANGTTQPWQENVIESSGRIESRDRKLQRNNSSFYRRPRARRW